MKEHVKRFIASIVIGLLWQGGAAAMTLVLHDAVVVNAGEVYLRDIATVKADPAEQTFADAVQKYVICKAPRAGFTRELDKRYIVMKLKQWDVPLSGLQFAGAQYVSVSRKEDVVTIAAQQRFIKEWIAGKLGYDMRSFNVCYKTKLRDITVPSGEVKMVAKGQEATFLRRNAGIYVEYFVAGTLIARMVINFSLMIEKDILVTTTALKKEQALSEQACERKHMFVPAYAAVCCSYDDIHGFVAHHDIPAGVILTKEDCEPKKMVARGDVVDGLIVDKNMRMVVKMQACEDGFFGDVIKVLNTTTGTSMSGRVQRNGLVELGS